MRQTRIFAIVLSLLLVMTAFLPVSAQVAVTEPGQLPLVEEPLTLTLGIASNATVTDWETNEQSLYIEEVTGITLDFIELSKDEYITKVNLMIAAGGADLPDALIGSVSSESTLVSWGETGLILPLNDYYESGMNWFMRDSIETGCSVDYDTFVQYMTCYDGNIYGLPSYSESYNNEISSNRLIIYQPWLDQLSIDRHDILTTGDLYDVMVKFRDNDMNGNGDSSDEVPLISSTNYIGELRRALMNPFIYTASNYLIAEDGVVSQVFDRDAFREGIRFARKLVVDGLLMPESFTQDEKQMTAIQTQELPVCGVVARVSTSNIANSDPKRYEYLQLQPLTGPEGVCENPVTPSKPSVVMMITSTCENPDAAFRLGDYLCSQEMTIWGKFGRKDKEWHEPLEGELSAYTDAGYPTVIAVTNANSWADVSNHYWANSGPRIYGTLLFFGQAETGSGPARDLAINNALDIIEAHKVCDYDKYVGNLPLDEDETDVYDSVYTPIINYVDECWSRFVLGDLDIDSDTDWNAFVAEAKGMDLDAALEVIQAAYDRLHT